MQAMKTFRRSLLGLALLAVCLLGAPGYASAQSPANFAALAGDWSAHGFGLSIASDGQAVAHWRVYQWCSDLSSPAPCDSMLGNDIENGGLAMLRFTSLSGGVGTATVLMSSDPATLSPGSSVTMRTQSGGTARLTTSGSLDMVLCGPKFDPSQFTSAPCGA
jgi:hypothetical protein